MTRWLAVALLLHLRVTLSVAPEAPAKPSPRGFKAAYDVQQAVAQQAAQVPPPQHQQSRAAKDAACAAPPVLTAPPTRLPLPLQQQQCRLSAAGWAVVLGIATAVFACGVAVGAWLRRSVAVLIPVVAHHPLKATAAEPAGPKEDVGEAGPPQPLADAAAAAASGAAVGGGAVEEQAAAPACSSSGGGGESAARGLGAAASAAEVQQQPAGASAAPTLQAEAVEAVEVRQQAVVLTAQQAEQEPPQTGGGGGSRVALQTGISLSSSARALVVGAGDSGSASMLPEADRADIVAAGALVAELTRSLQIDVAELSAGERLQLVHTVLAAWQAQQAKRHSEAMTRLGSEANVLRGSQRDIAAQQAQHKRARDAHALARERVAQFRRTCSDTLSFGLAVMLAVAGYQAARGGGAAGAAATLLAQCGRWSAPPSAWGVLWRGWGGLRTAGCYIFTAGDAALGLAVLLAAPWAVYRTGLLSDVHTLPVTRLLAGLGLGCGLAGWVAVGKLGGDRGLWLAVWEAWVLIQVIFSAAAHRIFRATSRAMAPPGLNGSEGSAAALAAARDMYDRSFSWLYAAMWALVGVVLPTMAGWLPFRV